MNNENKTFPNVQLCLQKQSIVFLYKFLLYYEDVKRSKNTTGFNIRRKEIQSFLKQKNITLAYNQNLQQCGKNMIIYSGSSSAGWDLLRHIRNAVAHGTISNDRNGLHLIDKYKGELTMNGNLTARLLLPLIDVIVSTRK